MREGDSLILTGSAGAEGTLVMINNLTTKMLLTPEDKKEAAVQYGKISCVLEGLVAAKYANAAVSCADGGVLTALYKICQGSNMGAKIFEADIPVSEMTSSVCREKLIDPLRLSSLGCMLISTTEPEALMAEFGKHEINCKLIGIATKKREGVMITCIDGMIRPVAPNRPDELTRIYA